MNRITLKPAAFVLVFAWVFTGFSAFGIAAAAETGGADSLNNKSGNGTGSRKPIVIAHRGASGLRPEHTLAAYQLALDQGADFIELDLVATRDGALISRHENALAMVQLDDQGGIVRDSDGRPMIREATTDIAERPEFSERLTVKLIDGRPVGGWFSEDFTLAEVRTLRARERMPRLRPANRQFDDLEGIPTLGDVLRLIGEWQQRSNVRPGLYIELKHPTHFLVEGRTLDGEPIGLDLAERLLDELAAEGFTDSGRVFLQCFEVGPLMALKESMAERGMDLPLIQLFGDVHNRLYRAAPRDLIYYAGQGDTARYGDLNQMVEGGLTTQLSYADLATPRVLAFMADHYARGIGPPRQNVLKIGPGADGRTLEYLGTTEPLLSDAQRRGLLVHPYTLRAETPFLLRSGDRTLSVTEEAGLLLKAGVDGFFIDQPALGRLAVDTFLDGAATPVLEAGDRL